MPTRVFITGYRGTVGSALVRAIEAGKPNWELLLPSRDQLDLLDQAEVDRYIKLECPDIVINAATKVVGGIHANSTYPAEFIHAKFVYKFQFDTFFLDTSSKSVFEFEVRVFIMAIKATN